ncbi:MAG: class I SAM-dependent methyltransferase [Flavobacteriales bacterium]
MNIDNQKEYWDSVAEQKTFTHKLDHALLGNCVQTDSHILDYGCGYGRIVKELLDLGYTNVVGFDTSKELVKRGKRDGNLPLYHIENPVGLSVAENSLDCVLLFAVLTCIPSNKGQKELMNLLYSKLKPNGILYISDYYLQHDITEVGKYEFLEGDEQNFGVFHLAEGVVFRHHTKEWISELTANFNMLEEHQVTVKTMNGHEARAFQLILRK